MSVTDVDQPAIELEDDPNKLQNDISTIVRTLMALRGVKQGDIAAKLGIDSSGVSDKITHRNNRRWTPENLQVLAVFFGVPVQTFYSDPLALLRIPEYAFLRTSKRDVRSPRHVRPGMRRAS